MKPIIYLFVLFLLISFGALGQTSTPNIGFEDGSFNHWECFVGFIDSAGNINVTSSANIYDRHTMIGAESAGITDPYGKFPVLCPNGSKHSIRLGNSDTAKQAERVTYTFTVPSESAFSIIFNYAVVLQNPNHQPYQQPKFTARVYDISDSKYIDCPSFNFVAGTNLPGFKLSNVVGARGASIYYKDWSTATVDLHLFAGKTMRIEFTTNDCTKGAHFGYAYLDVIENTDTPIAGNAYCAGQKSVTLYAPNGFASYQWFNGDLSQQVGVGQSITLSPPPPDLSKFAVKIFPYPDLGCVDTLYTIVNRIDEGFRLNVMDTVHGCTGEGADLTAPAVTAGSSAGMTLTYFNDVLGTSHLYNPNKITTPGTYYIQGVNKEGCMNILPVQVVIGLPPLDVSDPEPITFPAAIDLSKTFTHHPGVTYSYYNDASTSSPVQNYTNIQYSNKFYIKAEDLYGCDTMAQVNVVVNPPAPYTVTAPTAFTPNSDGINDHFIVTLAGIASFQSVRIFNRYGQLVFTAKSPGEFWDGNFNGQKLPAGTYYWVFEGMDDYYKRKFSKAAYITLLR